jgi:hypothetical protein
VLSITTVWIPPILGHSGLQDLQFSSPREYEEDQGILGLNDVNEKQTLGTRDFLGNAGHKNLKTTMAWLLGDR